MKTNHITSINFGDKFKTREILSFISGHPLEKFYSEVKENRMIRFMTGINAYDRDTFALMHKTYAYDTDCSKLALINMCVDEMEKQNPALKGAIESCGEIFTTEDKDKAEIFSWAKKQLKRLGTKMNIEPFEFSKKKYLNEYGYVGGHSMAATEKWAFDLDFQA